MPTVKYDVSDVEDVQDREPAPVGIYRAKIVKAELKESKKGNQMIEVQLTLTHDAAGKKIKPNTFGDVWTYPILDHDHDYVKAQLKEFLLATTGKAKGSLNTDKLVDTAVQVKLKSDTDEDGEYRPRVGKIMALAAGLPEEEEEEEEEEDGAEDDDASDTYTAEELGDLAKDELQAVAEEQEVEWPSGKMTAAKKKALIAAIVESYGEEEEAEEEDEEEEEDEDEGVDLDELDRKALKAFIKSEELEIKVTTKMSDDDLRAAIAEAMGEEEEDEEEEDDEEEEEGEDVDYSTWSVADLKKELGERELNVSGSKKVLAARLKKDDESDPF